jgi:PAT family beta-lactamase induction signal transducer AmpG
VLLLVGFYRISDIVMGVIANVFYQDMSYTKIEIASVSKAFGVLMTIAGSFLGALIALRIGIMRALQFAAILVVLTNLLFCWLSMVGTAHTDFSFSLPLFGNFRFPLELTLVIGVDNLVQGLSLAAFIAWLSSLTNVSFTATQYAIFSSLMTMLPKVIGGYAGTLVDAYGYMHFFLFAALLGVPVIVLIHFLSTKLSFEAEPATR